MPLPPIELVDVDADPHLNAAMASMCRCCFSMARWSAGIGWMPGKLRRVLLPAQRLTRYNRGGR